MNDEQRSTRLDRRSFLGALVASFLAACSPGQSDAPAVGSSATMPADTASTTSTIVGSTTPTEGSAPPAEAESLEPLTAPEVALPADAFGLGVASGEPDDRSVVVWTRLVGDLPSDFEMVWEVASDEAMATLVATGLVTVAADHGHSVRVLVEGLAPNQTFHYRFRAGSLASVIGRTRTMPASSSRQPIRLGVSSCQARSDGAWAAHRDMADAPIDAVVWLGDYIYGDHRSLDDYRSAYAEYRSDPLLQANHAAHPWFVFTDDHEVANDYDASVDPARRAAAMRAWWENQPTRLPPPDPDGRLQTYRSFDLGGTARLLGLDVRQFADADSLLGEDQWRFVEAAADHKQPLTVLASPVLMSGVRDLAGDPLLPYSIDTRPAERERLGAVLARMPGPLIVSGDLHTSLVADYRVDPLDDDSESLAVEIMAPAISSSFPDRFAAFAPLLPLVNPQLRTVEVQNGWLELVLGADDALNAAFHFVDDVADPGSSITVRAV